MAPVLRTVFNACSPDGPGFTVLPVLATTGLDVLWMCGVSTGDAGEVEL